MNKGFGKRLHRFWLTAGIGLVCWLLAAFAAGEERDGDLSLTPDQSQALQELRLEFQREMLQIRRKLLDQRLQLRTLSREDYQGEKGEALRREMRSLMIQARERSLFYRQKAFELLTPEQQKRIPPQSSMGFHCPDPFSRGGWGRGWRQSPVPGR